MNTFDKVVTGVTVIGLITAFGLHASSLTGLARSTGSAASGLMGTVEKG
jgi:hypothetical protein